VASVGNRSLRLIKPVVGTEEEQLIHQVLMSGWLSEGPMTRKFEGLVKDLIGARHAIAVSSCTTGMEIGLRAMGIGSGDEVLIPDFTHPATANAIIAVGAEPVLVDTDLSSYNIDLEEARKTVTRKTRAMIPVSWGGNPLDDTELKDLKDSTNILVMEDAACSIGAQNRGVKSGAMADITVFSFHPRKVITTGEGGMITTDNDDYAQKLGSLKNFGLGKLEGEIGFVGYGTNYKMSDLLAAIGVAQMGKLPQIIQKRIELAENYNKLLSNINGIRPPQAREEAKHTYQTYAAYIDVKGARDKLIQDLRSVGIETQIGTYALHTQPYYSHIRRYGTLSRSQLLYENLLALPMCHDMTRDDQEYVSVQIEQFLKNYRP